MPYTVIMHGKLEDKRESEEWDMCEPYTTCTVIETDDSLPLTEEEKDSIRCAFERGCGCARDCCGHYNGGVDSITPVWTGRYVVLSSYIRNY